MCFKRLFLKGSAKSRLFYILFISPLHVYFNDNVCLNQIIKVCKINYILKPAPNPIKNCLPIVGLLTFWRCSYYSRPPFTLSVIFHFNPILEVTARTSIVSLITILAEIDWVVCPWLIGRSTLFVLPVILSSSPKVRYRWGKLVAKRWDIFYLWKS